ncbi:MAG: hypothetical protein ABIR62_02305 [Dokdonella sp.]
MFRSARSNLCVALIALSMASAHAQSADPAMSAAVFEDVQAPLSAPAGPSSTIATVTLPPPAQSRTEADLDADNGIAQDPDKSLVGAIRFEDLPHQIGSRVRVLTRGHRTHLGVVQSADAKQLTLSINQRGGSATYVLSRAQVERIDPR